MTTLISFILACIFLFFIVVGLAFFGFVALCIILDVKHHYERHQDLDGWDGN